RPEIRDALAELRARITSFDHIGQVDWPVDLDLLGEGILGEAVNRHAEDFNRVPFPVGVFFPSDPLLGYRDYLVSVWAKLAAADWHWANQTPLTSAQALQQLQNRFHQNFTTTDKTA